MIPCTPDLSTVSLPCEPRARSAHWTQSRSLGVYFLPLFSSMSSSLSLFPIPLLYFLGSPPQINCLHSDPCLRVCFWGNSTWTLCCVETKEKKGACRSSRHPLNLGFFPLKGVGWCHQIPSIKTQGSWGKLGVRRSFYSLGNSLPAPSDSQGNKKDEKVRFEERICSYAKYRCELGKL